jgi:hypothetical protein
VLSLNHYQSSESNFDHFQPDHSTLEEIGEKVYYVTQQMVSLLSNAEVVEIEIAREHPPMEDALGIKLKEKGSGNMKMVGVDTLNAKLVQLVVFAHLEVIKIAKVEDMLTVSTVTLP